jgi:hypothetical protein
MYSDSNTRVLAARPFPELSSNNNSGYCYIQTKIDSDIFGVLFLKALFVATRTSRPFVIECCKMQIHV